MGEGRGKLEGLIADLEAKKAELEKLIEEYELMLPHLTSARDALDDAGITETGPSQPTAEAPAAKSAAKKSAPESDGDGEAEPAEEAPAEEAPAEDSESAPARRSIASLVAEDEGAGDEATH